MIHPYQVDWADLTANQPNGYLNRLPEDGPAVLAFFGPRGADTIIVASVATSRWTSVWQCSGNGFGAKMSLH